MDVLVLGSWVRNDCAKAEEHTVGAQQLCEDFEQYRVCE